MAIYSTSCLKNACEFRDEESVEGHNCVRGWQLGLEMENWISNWWRQLETTPAFFSRMDGSSQVIKKKEPVNRRNHLKGHGIKNSLWRVRIDMELKQNENKKKTTFLSVSFYPLCFNISECPVICTLFQNKIPCS